MNREERHFTLKKLQEAKRYWLAKSASQKATTSDGVTFTSNEQANDNIIPFPGPASSNGNGVQRDKSLSRGSHPELKGKVYWQQEGNNPDYIQKAGFTSALILAGITFVVETGFLLLSYFWLK
jgi:hypothetical protein